MIEEEGLEIVRREGLRIERGEPLTPECGIRDGASRDGVDKTEFGGSKKVVG